MKLALPFFFALLIPNPAFCRTSAEEVGDRFRITLHHTFESEDGEGSTSSSTGTHAYLQQVRAVRPDGVEKVYDLPLGGDDEKRLVNWQFPVRVLEAKDGHLEILNRNELEKRRDRWLAAAEIPADACGSWYFTWTAFQVECDPDAVLETVGVLAAASRWDVIQDIINALAKQSGSTLDDVLEHLPRLSQVPEFELRAAQRDLRPGGLDRAGARVLPLVQPAVAEFQHGVVVPQPQ